MERIVLNSFQIITWCRLDDLYVLTRHILRDIVNQRLGLRVVRPGVHPGVVAAPGDYDVVFPEVLRQIDSHFNERNGPLLRIEVSQGFVGDEGVIGFTGDALAVNIKELPAGLTAVTMNNTGEKLVLVSEVGRGRLPDEVHSQLILLQQILLQILVNLCEKLSVETELCE